MSSKIIRCDFQFKCPLNWDDLEKLKNDKIRFCDVCRKNVNFVETQSEFDNLAKQGNCVAIKSVIGNNEVLTVSNNNVCNNCNAPISKNSPVCRKCGILIVDSNDFPRMTMGLPSLPPDITKIPENPPPKKKKPWWKPWE